MTTRPYLIGGLFLLFGCARQTTPDGGPKDLLPPTLLRSNPSNNQKNFKDKTITLVFSEAVKLKDPREEIIVSPKPGKDLTFLAKQNRVTIESKAGWRDSTTYSIAFRDGIQDITESNPAENLRIAFSTGPIIDSLTLRGRVVDALTEKIPQKITVAIYQSDTFNIFKHAPVYFTKTDKNGKFIITNLKQGAYRIYAFDDKNKNLKVETTTEKFGFIPGHVTMNEKPDSLRIILLNLDSRPVRITNIRHSDKFSTVKFNKAVVNYSATFHGKHVLNAFGRDQSEIKFFHHLPPSDSLQVNLHATDSLDQKVDTLIYLKAGTTASVGETFKTTLLQSAINGETAIFTATIALNKPLLNITTDSILLKIDSLTNLVFTSTDLLYDTTNNKIEFNKKLDKKLLANLITPMDFFVSKNSFISIENDSSKVITKKITTPKPEDTATLLLEVQTTQDDFAVELLTTEYKVVQTVRNTKKITFKNVAPAEYKIRIYIDQNKNNHWDPGNINKDIPPETTYFYQNANGKYQFPLRANWEVGPYIIAF